MNGVLVVDKPEGITSNKVIHEVKRLLNTRKAGHNGTLDPFATGVLPVFLNGATKAIPFVDDRYKIYEAELTLGIETDTLDKTGKVISSKPINKLTNSEIFDVFKEFRGEIHQVPPMFSALKHNGRRLYEIARKGIIIDREPRLVEIAELELIKFDLPLIRFFVKCSKGTYIRSLAFDIANKLGHGGHLSYLRRLQNGVFDLKDTVSMEDLIIGKIKLFSIENVLKNLKTIDIGKELSAYILNGKQISKIDLLGYELPSFNVGEKLKVLNNSKIVSIVKALVNSNDLGKLEDDREVFKLLRVFNNFI